MDLVPAQMCYQIAFAEIASGRTMSPQSESMTDNVRKDSSVSYAVICRVAFQKRFNQQNYSKTIDFKGEEYYYVVCFFSYGAMKIGEVTL
jgi:hypothetical protein